MSSRTLEFEARRERDTVRLGELLAAGLRPDLAGRAVVVAIEGTLGAGKTRFVRGLAAGLGADPDAIASPTFVLMAEHAGEDARLVHVDAWRMRGAADLESLGWDDVLAESPCVVAIEWASRIAAALPEERVDVMIEAHSATERHLTIVDRRGEAEATRVAAALAHFTPSESTSESRCPVCRGRTEASSPTFPFCSSRCRMADLGRWFGGAYRVSRPIESDEELSE